MRSLIIGAAALLAVAAPGVAAAQTGGSVGVIYADLDDDNDPSKENAIGIEGIVLTEAAPGWAVGVRGASYDMDHGNHDHGFSQVEGSASYQINDMVSVGGHVGHANLADSSLWTYGVSARVDVNQFWFGASASGSSSESAGDDPSNVTVEAGMGVMENLGVSINASWSDFGGAEVDSLGIGAGYMIPGTQVEVGAFYRQSDFDSGGETSAWGLRLAYALGENMSRRRMLGSEHMLYDSIAAF